MYRVELKAELPSGGSFRRKFLVPNVPCGVERTLARPSRTMPKPFLMYRVELKAQGASVGCNRRSVFLMYRVELKECVSQRIGETLRGFLMYRVELKEGDFLLLAGQVFSS